MSKVILTILLYGLLAAWEVPRLRGKNEKKEWIAFSLLMIAGLVLSMLFVFHVTV